MWIYEALAVSMFRCFTDTYATAQKRSNLFSEVKTQAALIRLGVLIHKKYEEVWTDELRRSSLLSPLLIFSLPSKINQSINLTAACTADCQLL